MLVSPDHNLFIFDVPRSTRALPYSFIEQLLDGYVFSPKYESCNKELHEFRCVFVFTNEEPDYSELSSDRWNVHLIN